MKKFLSLIVVFSLMLTSCGSGDIPELIAPYQTVDVYYTVEKGTIENKKILDGYIAPSTEMVYFETSGKAYDISYKVGDIVKKGDVIITLNEDVDEKIDELSKQLSQYSTISDYYITQHEEEIAAMKKNLSGKTGLDYDLYELDIRQQQLEFDRFDQQREDEYSSMKTEYENLVSKQSMSEIIAPCDGTIVYLGVFSDGDSAVKNQIACVIADDSQKIIQFDYFDNEYIENLDDFYIKIGNNTYNEIELMTYTEDELDYYSLYGYKLYSRALVPELSDEIEFGTYCAVYMISDKVENTIYVPNESINYDTESYSDFCYVLNDDGTQEKAYIETGVKTKYYTEVLSGLTEGQKIYFTDDAASWSGNITSTEVILSDYKHYISYEGAYKTAQKSEKFYIDYPGKVKEIYIDKTTDIFVEEGTPLFTLTPYVDESVYEQAKIDYDNAVSDYESGIEDYDGRIEDKQEEIDNADNIIDKTIAEYELEILKEEKADYIETQNKKINKLESDLAVYETCLLGEDVVIIAPYTGILNISGTLVGAEYSKDQSIGSISNSESYVIYVSDSGSNGFLKYGNRVTVSSSVNGDLTEVTAKVVTSSSLIPGEGGENAAIRLDTDADSVNVSANGAVVTVSDIEISNVVLLDTTFIFKDDDGKRYVILQYKDNYVKRYIEVASDVLLNDSYVWVKNGLNAGDVCIKF